MTEIMPFPENNILFYWAAPQGCFLFWPGGGSRTDLNADVRGTSACRQLDGGDTFIFFPVQERKWRSTPVSCSKKAALLWVLPLL